MNLNNSLLKIFKWKGNEISYDEVLLKILKKGGNLLTDTKQLTQLEIDNIIDETINLSIISKLLKLNLINEKQFYVLKEKIKSFY